MLSVMLIIGISAWFHDSAVAIVRDGKVICAAQEERFSRIKNDASFPRQALAWCCSYAGIKESRDADFIVFYEKPLIKFERLLETWISNSPGGAFQFARAMPSWTTQKLIARKSIAKELHIALGWAVPGLPPLLFNGHHASHAANSFFTSPFDKAAILCLDGVGEWDTSTAWQGEGASIESLWRIAFPHSLGLLYSAFASFCGFKVNSGEYKLMGLAPYGTSVYADLIESELIDIREDGSFNLNMRYFSYQTAMKMTNRHFNRLFGGAGLPLGGTPGRREMDMAASIQRVLEKVVIRMASNLQQATGAQNLCLGGGVALNCVANGVLQRAGLFKEIWVPPAPGDAGNAVGAALSVWHEYLQKPRRVSSVAVKTAEVYLGPQWNDSDIGDVLTQLGANFEAFETDALLARVAKLLAAGKIIGWFQGRMEFGPRALGNRSILGDPRDQHIVRRINSMVKYRESFRPFAPSVLADKAHEWFDFSGYSSPFMHTVTQVLPGRLTANGVKVGNLAAIHEKRSVIPAVTHVDMSARLHTVTRASNPMFYDLISCFDNETGVPMLVNTSFNVRGEPLVATPEDAWQCFMNTGMDALVVGSCLLLKEKQPQVKLSPDSIPGFGRD